MANPLRGEFPVMIGERELILVFDFNAMASVERACEKPAALVASEVTNSVEMLAAMLFAGAKARHDDVTMDFIQDNIVPTDPKAHAVQQAMSFALWGVDGPPSVEEGRQPKKKTVSPTNRSASG